MFSSHSGGVSTVEMKSTASCATSTMYSLAPMPSKRRHLVGRERAALRPPGPSPSGRSRRRRPAPSPTCRIGRSQVGQSSSDSRARVVLVLQPEQHEVAGVARRKAGDLEVVAHQVIAASTASCPGLRRTASGSSSTGPRSAPSRRSAPRRGCGGSCRAARRPASASRSAGSRPRGCDDRRSTSRERQVDPALEPELHGRCPCVRLRAARGA